MIGDYTAFSNQIYIQDIKNPDLVYVVRAGILEPFTRGVSAIINNHFLNRQIDDVAAIEFRNLSNQSISLTNVGGFWQTTDNDTQVDWGARKFLLAVKDFTFEPRTASFDISDLNALGIDSAVSPKLSLTFKDGSKDELVIGRPRQNAYPVYIDSNKFKAYADSGHIMDIFNTDISDFLRKN